MQAAQQARGTIEQRLRQTEWPVYTIYRITNTPRTNLAAFQCAAKREVLWTVSNKALRADPQYRINRNRAISIYDLHKITPMQPAKAAILYQSCVKAKEIRL